MSKTISHELLEQIGDPRKMSQRNLDGVMNKAERSVGISNKGLTTSVLAVFMPREGVSRLLSFSQVMDALGDAFAGKENGVQSVLDKLEEGSVLHTNENCDYRIPSNALAAQLFNKIEADRMVLRKVENFIQDRYSIFQEKNILLSQADLNYIEPYLSTISSTREELNFIQKSKDGISRKKKRRALIISLVITALSLISLFAFSQYIFANRAYKAEEKAKEQAELNRAAAEKYAEENRKLAMQKTAEADSIKLLLTQNKQLEQQAREEARANALLARDNKMLAEANRIKADSNATLAFLNANFAREAAQRASDYEQLAKKKAILADSATAWALREEVLAGENKALQQIAFSHSLAKQAIQMGDEQAELKSIIAHIAFRVNEKTKGGEIFQQDIYDALYQSAKSINQAKGNDNFNKINNERGSIRTIAFAKNTNGKIFYTISSSGHLKQWQVKKWNDIDKPKYIVKTLDKLGSTLNTMALSDDHRWLAVGGELPYILLYDLSDQKKKSSKPLRLDLHDGKEIFNLEFLPNSNSLLSLGADKKIQRYNISDKSTSTVSTANNLITAFTLSADAPHLLYYGTGSGELFEHNLAGEKKPLLIKSHRETSRAITAIDAVFNNGRRQLFIGYDNGQLKIIPAEPGGRFPVDRAGVLFHIISRFHHAKISNIAHSPNGKYIGVTSYDGRSTFWEVDKAIENLYYQPMVFSGDSWATAIGFSEETDHVLVGYREGELVFFNPDPTIYASFICNQVQRSILPEEWDLYIGEKNLTEDPYMETCKD